MKLKDLTAQDVKNIEIELSGKRSGEKGFTVWITEVQGTGKARKKIRYWILDGSCLGSDFQIRLGRHDILGHNVFAKYDKASNSIKIGRIK